MFFLQLLPIIVAYSIVQSLFGVGVLVFGTPTLLLMGLPFEKALGLLLPCSIVINSLQLLTDLQFVTLKKRFVANFVPFVGLGLLITLSAPLVIHPKPVIGLLLLLTAFIRLSDQSLKIAQKFFRKSLWISLPLVGLVHGLTNMGGGLLTILVSSLFDEKKSVRANVAFGYLIMAASQCLVLLFLRPEVFQWESAALAAIAGLTYLALGKRAFGFVSNRMYQTALTVFILFFGVILLR